MEHSYLIQRLTKSYADGNPFAFGGGLVNGGLSDEAYKALDEIFSFDYMGSAEFEFGEVPKALRKFASSTTLQAFTVVWPMANVYLDSFKTNRVTAKEKKNIKHNTLAEVFVIAPAEWRVTIARRIKEDWTTHSYVKDVKEQPRLASALRPVVEWDEKIKGWLELDNGFFFFVDRDMFKNTAKLFGVETELPGSVVK